MFRRPLCVRTETNLTNLKLVLNRKSLVCTMPPSSRYRPSAPSWDLVQYNSRSNAKLSLSFLSDKRESARNARIRAFLGQGLAVVGAGVAGVTQVAGGGRKRPTGEQQTSPDPKRLGTAANAFQTPQRGPPGIQPNISPAQTLMDVVTTAAPVSLSRTNNPRFNNGPVKRYFGSIRPLARLQPFTKLSKARGLYRTNKPRGFRKTKVKRR